MLCGIPGSGKTAAARSIESSLNLCGYKTVTSGVFYPASKALAVCHTGLLVNEQAEHYDNDFIFASETMLSKKHFEI